MRVLLAFDTFKEALSAEAACAAAAAALREWAPEWTLDVCPLTDGGEGFARVLTQAAGGALVPVPVSGPRRGTTVAAAFGRVAVDRVPPAALDVLGWSALPPGGSLALVELAAASGLELLAPEQRDPWQTTTQGTGELLAAAARAGVSGILLGVGGSATNDLGLGALNALGWSCLAADGAVVEWPAPAAWERVASLAAGPDRPWPPLRIACDVSNPLLGPTGCCAIYAPQKGLPHAEIPSLEAATARMAQRLLRRFSQPAALADTPGAGAAGGIAFGLMAAWHATLVPGSTLVSAWLGLDERIRAADLVLTGEGSFDATSLAGKGAGAIAARAAALGRRVHVFAGRVAPELRHRPDVHAITPLDCPLPDALAATPAFLAASLRQYLAGAHGGKK